VNSRSKTYNALRMSIESLSPEYFTEKPEEHAIETEQMKSAFEAQNESMAVLAESGMAGLLLKTSAEDRQKLFQPGEVSMCMDERNLLCACHQSAGSSILRGKEAAQAEWDADGVKVVTAHQGCGAAKAYWATQTDEIKQANPDPDIFVRDTLDSWAKEVGLDFRYIETKDMAEPATFHPARGIVIDATHKLNLTALPEMPKMFRLTPSENRDEGNQLQVVNDAVLAWKGIVNTDHGMGQWITKDKPFIISLSGYELDRKQLTGLAEELQATWLDENTTFASDPRVLVRIDIIPEDVRQTFDPTPAA
jgi:hypothetical protein